LRSISSCPGTATVPATAITATPDAKAPPTTVLQVGGALRFAAAAHASVGFTGPANGAEQRVVCLLKRAPRASGNAELLALRPGYVRVGTQAAGQTAQKLLLIKVTS
jgi:hypothetical protein